MNIQYKQIISFNCLPILSQVLYNVPKYLYHNSNFKETKNKFVTLNYLNKNDHLSFSSSYKYNYDLVNRSEGNTTIISATDIIGKLDDEDIKFEEVCKFNEFEINKTIAIDYSLKYFSYIGKKSYDSSCLILNDKINFNIKLKDNNEICDNFWIQLPKPTQNKLNKVYNILCSNKQNAK